MTKARKEFKLVLPLERIPCIHYPLCFKKDHAKIQALINSSSKVNAMAPAYMAKLGPKVRSINVEAQKINGSSFKTFGIVFISFQIKNKLGQARIF